MSGSKKFGNNFIILILFLTNIISCDLRGSISTDAVTLGTIITNYPEWCTGESVEQGGLDNDLLCYGYSPWIEWQSESGEKLHDFVDDKLVSGDYSGKFRVLLLSQHVYICFNDRNSTHALFFNYYGDYFDDGEGIAVPQSSNGKFEYNAWFRPYHLTGSYGYVVFDESCHDSNRSQVVMTRLSDTSFNYILTVAGEKIIDVNMSSFTSGFGTADLGVPDTVVKTEYWWVPDDFAEVDGEDQISFHCKDGNVFVLRPLCNTFYSFEGISLREIDEDKMTISFTLLDAGQSDFADYFEVGLTNVTKDLLKQNENRLRNHGTVTFYKITNEEPQVVRTYDPDKVEFYFGSLVYER